MATIVAKETEQNCILDLNSSYGRSAGRRFQRLLENRKSFLGRELKIEEILDVYKRFDLELKKTKPIKSSNF
jgi:hypothetical protein